MSLLSWLSRKSCYTFAICLVSVMTGQLACLYGFAYFHGQTHVNGESLLWGASPNALPYVLAILVVANSVTHYLCFGLLRVLGLRWELGRLNIINNHTEGLSIKSGLSLDVLTELLGALSRLPYWNTVMAGIVSFLAFLVFMAGVLLSTGNLNYLSLGSQAGFMTLLVILYLTYLVTEFLSTPARIQAKRALQEVGGRIHEPPPLFSLKAKFASFIVFMLLSLLVVCSFTLKPSLDSYDRIMIVLFTILSVALSSILCILYFQSIMRSFTEASAASEDLASGGPGFLFSGSLDREFILFSRSMNAASAEIQSRRNRLEDLVREKTQSLEQALKELGENERRFRAMVENGSALITILDADGKRKYASPPAGQVLGYTASELVGADPFDLIHPEDVPRVAELISEGMKKPGFTGTAEYRLRHKNGSWHTMEAIGQNLLQDPAVQGVVINARDITDRKKAEEQVRAGNLELRMINEVVSIANAAEGTQDLLDLILEKIVELLDFEAAAVYVINADKGVAILQSEEGAPRAVVERFSRLPVDQPPYSDIFQEGKPLRVDDLWALDPGWRGPARRTAIGGVPVSLGEQQMGALIVAKTKDPTFSEEDWRMLGLIGREMGSTIARLGARDRLQESRERYRRLAENIQDMIWITDARGKVLYMNSAVEQVTGYPVDQWIGSITGKYMTPESSREMARWIREADAATPRRNSFSVEVECLHIGGHTVPCEVNATILRDEQGTIVGYEGVTRDITRRKREEEALRERERHFRELAELLPEIIYEMNMEGVLTFVNEQALETTGYSQEDFDRGFHAIELLVPEDRERCAETVLRLIQGDSKGVSEYTAQRKDGSRFPVMARSTVVVRDGEVIGVRGIIVDLTDVKRTEEALRKAKEEAEAASLAKSQFLANMSHEIRTPMNGMMGMVDLLARTDLTEKQRGFVNTARRSSEALLRIINDILDFSKIEAGKLRLEKVDFDLCDIVEQTVALFTDRARKQGLKVACEIAENVPAFLCGDPIRVGQLLGNLIANGVKFTPEGEVAVRVSCLEQSRSDVLVRFDVVDTGIGIPREAQNHIFDVFSQADGSTTRKFGGTGLGLAIGKQLAEMMGGEIGLESEPGKGSNFWFTARLEYGAQPRVPTASLTDRVPTTGGQDKLDRSACILLAEDNPVNQEVALNMLEALGCRVELAADGREALEKASRSGFDLILMDCQMPEMDGYEATRLIRESEQASGAEQDATPIVALTANAMEGDRDRCLAAGMDDYLSKPFTQDRLCEVLRRWLKNPVIQDDGAVPDEPNAEAPSSSGDERVSVDRKALDTIRALQRKGKPDLLARVINVYLEDSLRLLEALRQALSQDDRVALKRQAHTLKSSSANVGALRLAALCKELEAAQQGEPNERIRQTMVRMEEEYETVRNELTTELERISA